MRPYSVYTKSVPILERKMYTLRLVICWEVCVCDEVIPSAGSSMPCRLAISAALTLHYHAARAD